VREREVPRQLLRACHGLREEGLDAGCLLSQCLQGSVVRLCMRMRGWLVLLRRVLLVLLLLLLRLLLRRHLLRLQLRTPLRLL
jgi:hypothetical protein